MALDPLATTTDLDARGIAWGDQVLAETYLAVASSAIRDAAGCPISEVTSTVEVWPGNGGPDLRLPVSPVTSVTAVVLDGTTLTQGTDYVLRQGALYRPCGWLSCGVLPRPVTATVVHGLAEVPADLVDLVCRMASAALVAASASDDGAGLATGSVVSERLGDYSVTYSPDSGATEMELSKRTFDRIRARFGGGAAMVAIK
jgi:hypothetical protein